MSGAYWYAFVTTGLSLGHVRDGAAVLWGLVGRYAYHMAHFIDQQLIDYYYLKPMSCVTEI